jgi:hypothetical protein
MKFKNKLRTKNPEKRKKILIKIIIKPKKNIYKDAFLLIL